MTIWTDEDVEPKRSNLAPWQQRPFAWLAIGWGFLALVAVVVLGTLIL